ncbi:type VI secretion system tip protein VgrG, partial [Acinetobacter bereziniae]|nr:type VI secretion system tip protein VgrG [Acinetobacter bereziniae]
GITIITPAKFESRAGQHLFKSGEKAEVDLPILPLSQLNELCALKSKFGEEQDVK